MTQCQHIAIDNFYVTDCSTTYHGVFKETASELQHTRYLIWVQQRIYMQLGSRMSNIVDSKVRMTTFRS